MKRALGLLALTALGAAACSIPFPKQTAADGGTIDGAAACAAAIVCDDFERSTWDPFWNDLSPKDGSITIDRTKAHRGTSSLHFHTPAHPANVASELSFGHTPFTRSEFYLRAFVFIPDDAPPPRGENLVSLSKVDGSSGLLVNRTSNLLVATWGPPTGYEQVGTDGIFSVGAWDCLEVHVAVGAGGAPKVEIWLRDTEYPIGFKSPINLDPIGSVSIGINIPSTSAPLPAYDLWLDDVIVDTVRVGCAR